MINGTFDLRGTETHIEVHKFRAGAVAAVAIFALVVQALLPVYFPRADILDLPLLVTIYFGLSRRNPSTALLLGTGIGLFQDSLSKSPLGLCGIAKTIIGYVGSYTGTTVDTVQPT